MDSQLLDARLKFPAGQPLSCLCQVEGQTCRARNQLARDSQTRKRCSGCALPVCDKCWTVHCDEEHSNAERSGGLTLESAKAANHPVLPPGQFSVLQSKRKCHGCAQSNALRQCAVCSYICCVECAAKHCACELKPDPVVEMVSQYGAQIMSRHNILQSPELRTLVSDCGLTQAPPCHDAVSQAEGKFHVLQRPWEAAVNGAAADPAAEYHSLGWTASGSDANNLLQDLACAVAWHKGGQGRSASAQILRPKVAVADGATVSVRGTLRPLSSRAYASWGNGGQFCDTEYLLLRPILCMPTPLGDSYTSEVGHQREDQAAPYVRPRSSCATCVTDRSTRMAAATAEAKAAAPAAIEAAKAAAAYVDTVRANPLSTKLVPDKLSAEEHDCLRVLADRWRRLEESGHPVGVFLVELFTAHLLEGYSYAFLLALRHLCTEAGVLLAVDDIMMGMRTGHLFSFQLYPGFYPDVVTFGKPFQVSGVIRIQPRQQPGQQRVSHAFSPGSKLAKLDVHFLPGWLTNGGADRMTVARSIAILQQWKSTGCGSKARAIGGAVVKLVARLIDSGRSKEACIRGIGLIFYTNCRFNPEAAEAMAYARFILCADLDLKLLEKVLTSVRPTGFNRDTLGAYALPSFASQAPGPSSDVAVAKLEERRRVLVAELASIETTIKAHAQGKGARTRAQKKQSKAAN